MRFRQTQGKCSLLLHNNSTHFTCRLFTKVAAFGIGLDDFTKKFYFFHVRFGKRFNFSFKLRSRLSASTALASITSLSALIFLNSRSWSSSDFFLNIGSFRKAIISLFLWCSCLCSGRIVRYASWFATFQPFLLLKCCLPHFRRYFHSSHEFVHQMNENHWFLLHYQRFWVNKQNTIIDGGTVTLYE